MRWSVMIGRSGDVILGVFGGWRNEVVEGDYGRGFV